MKPYLFLIVIFLCSCAKENQNSTQNQTENSVSGKFSLALAKNLKSAAVLKSTDSIGFVLDTIRSSRSFFFILNNVGESDITNVSITSDNAAFQITPSSISLLPGTKSDSSESLLQIIELDVIHGTRLNGVGYTSLLNGGNNYCNLTFKGQTTNGSKTVTIAQNVRIQVYADVMAITLSQDDHYITKSNFESLSEFGLMIGYTFSSLDPVYLKNIGNVNINMNLEEIEYNSTVVRNTYLPTQDSVIINNMGNPNYSYVVELISNGTIFNQTFMSLGSDGNAYFGFETNTTPDTLTPVDTTKVISRPKLFMKRN